MQTIGRNWPSDAPRGDFAMDCSDCGVRWRRSQCRRNRSGWWMCPDCDKGMDPASIAQAETRTSGHGIRAPREGGAFSRAGFPDPVTGDPTEVNVQRTTREDI